MCARDLDVALDCVAETENVVTHRREVNDTALTEEEWDSKKCSAVTNGEPEAIPPFGWVGREFAEENDLQFSRGCATSILRWADGSATIRWDLSQERAIFFAIATPALKRTFQNLASSVAF